MSTKLGVKEAHGHLAAGAKWALPHCVAPSAVPSRPDQGNKTESSEFVDTPSVLLAKMRLVADLIRRSRSTVVYSGAGISRSSGIPDYGTKASNSIVGNLPVLANVADAQPTYAHHVLTALERAGYMDQWVQQNHDGLPQKAGFPQEKINEIHGAWFDPSNPVVPFSGSLRGDLFQKMCETEEKTTLCLCLGTSLSGMNADRCAETPARRMMKGKDETVLGTVIINLQRTRLDDVCAVRVWAKLDDALKILATELRLKVGRRPMALPKSLTSQGDVFRNLPYGADGVLDRSKRSVWDLRKGQLLVISIPEAVNARQQARVCGKDAEGNYIVQFVKGMNRRKLGRWFVLSAANGMLDRLPMVNVDAQVTDAQSGGGGGGGVASVVAAADAAVLPRYEVEVDEEEDDGDQEQGGGVGGLDIAAPAAVDQVCDAAAAVTLSPTTATTASTRRPATTTTSTTVRGPTTPTAPPTPTFTIVQSHQVDSTANDNRHIWSLELVTAAPSVLSVTYTLHPTFHPRTVTVSEAPYRITRVGWGTFSVGVTVNLENGSNVKGSHALCFGREGTEVATTRLE